MLSTKPSSTSDSGNEESTDGITTIISGPNITQGPQITDTFQYYAPGQCFYNINTQLSLEPHIDLDFIASKIDINIYENPLFTNTLTFGENVSWGCSEKLSLAELKLICINQIWKSKMIYDVMTNLTFVGQFGNPERHFILDWLQVDDFSLDNYQSIWDDLTNKCLIPAILNIDVVYANFGLVNETQSAIMKLTRRLENVYWYGVADESVYKDDGFSYSNLNVFNTYIKINYFKITQSTVWYFAPGPKPVFPKNIMYPFLVGETKYWKSSAFKLNIKNNKSTFIFFFTLLMLFYW